MTNEPTDREPIARRHDYIGQALEFAGTGRLIRTQGQSDSPLWWIRESADLADEALRWRRIFSHFGVGRERLRLMVALPNQDLAAGAMRGAEALDVIAMNVEEIDGPDIMVQYPIDFIVTTPLTAYRLFLRGLLGSIDHLLLTGDVSGQGALARRLRSAYPHMIVRDIYTLTEYPGPLAVECALGNWHWFSDDVKVQVMEIRTGRLREPGETGTVMISDQKRRAFRLWRYNTEDVATVLDNRCGCGHDSALVTTPLWGRLQAIRAIDNRWISPGHLAQAWYGTRGVGDRLRAFLSPIGDQEDALVIDFTVLEGYDPEAVQDALRQQVIQATGLTPLLQRVAPRELIPSVSCQILDYRSASGYPAWL